MVGKKYGMNASMATVCNDDQGFVDDWDNDAVCLAWTTLPTAARRAATSIARRVRAGMVGSLHPNGVQFVLCDGTVRAVNYGVTASVWLAIISMNDGKAVMFPEG